MRRVACLVGHLATPQHKPSSPLPLRRFGHAIPTPPHSRLPFSPTTFLHPCASFSSFSFSSSSSQPTLQDIRPLLTRPDLFHQSNYLNGSWQSVSPSSTSSIPVTNPSTGAIIGHVPSLTPDALHRAIHSSAAAQSRWSAVSPHQRGRILRRWYELMLAHDRDLGTLMSLEQGKPVKDAIAEIHYAAGFLDVYAGEAARQYGDVIPSPTPSSRITVTYEPVGVVAAITPWNFPAAMITRKVGAAIAAGCSVVLKPSELTPFSALALCALALEAGLPADVFQVVTGDAGVIGPVLTTHPLIRKVTFTGSTRVGKLLIAQTASTVKRTSMELGGNAPLIIFEDADVSSAVSGILANKLRNCGQACVAINRIYAHTAVMDAVVRGLRAEMEKLTVGDGLAEGVALGPLINEAAVQKVERHVKDALAKGGRLVTGGRRLTRADSALIPERSAGLFYAPTIVTNASRGMECFSEETFGPVAFFYAFSTEEEVVQAANDTRAGLASYVYTRDVGRAERVSRALEYGMVGVNQASVSVPVAPFGGVKESGYGREGSHHGLKDYLVMKTTHTNIA